MKSVGNGKHKGRFKVGRARWLGTRKKTAQRRQEGVRPLLASHHQGAHVRQAGANPDLNQLETIGHQLCLWDLEKQGINNPEMLLPIPIIKEDEIYF